MTARDGHDVVDVLLLGELRVVREGVAVLLRHDPRLRVTTAAPMDAETLVGGRPGAVVVLVDCDPGLVEAAAARVHRPIVVCGPPDGAEAIIRCAEAGVVGFVDRESSPETLAEAVLCAAHGGAWCPPAVASALLERVVTMGSHPVEPLPLTARERQIVELIGDGLSNKQIARELYIELGTVKNHVHNILEKLQVSRRGDAVARLRLVKTGSSARQSA